MDEADAVKDQSFFKEKKMSATTPASLARTETTEKDFLAAYEQYAGAIYRHCYFRVFNKDLAEDLTQETFIKTWKYIAEGKKIENIKAFLYRVAVNLIIDNSRKKVTLVFDDVKEKEVSVRLNSIEKDMLDGFELKEVLAIMEELPEKYRDVITFRYINDMSPVEIASVLEESANAVSVRLNYATKKLKELIKVKYHES
ncbi:MAG: RNA polymerase sigma factor [Candidatus Paceibacterales bacterium]